MAKATQQSGGSVIPKSAGYIDLYMRGIIKKKKPKAKEDKAPKLTGSKALVAKYQQGEKLKGVRSVTLPRGTD